ncbi:MAG: hypothetical protein DI598_00300 [Pseudopedobacter saltans]|uniref:Uncharacterized protein n=1 Tax=Pseudopedobacter saltans TaxID=151895 RepID=A0A2W5FFX7_9SPHI|nr:MAG: hypothetical protein DI598_00300 [Pseudopedobacter saltans]
MKMVNFFNFLLAVNAQSIFVNIEVTLQMWTVNCLFVDNIVILNVKQTSFLLGIKCGYLCINTKLLNTKLVHKLVIPISTGVIVIED